MARQSARGASAPSNIGISTGQRIDEGWAPRSAGASEGALDAPEQRREKVAVAAYFRAERRGFAGDDPVEDWLEAEREVDGIEQQGGRDLSD